VTESPEPDPRAKVFAGALADTQSRGTEKYVYPNRSVQDDIAKSDAQNRITVSRWIMWVFGTVNLVTIAFIIWLAFIDQAEITGKLIEPVDRVVNSQVIMSLLGATTVQLGTIALIMARYVFKDPG
jgi:hypothetical protein